MVKYRSASLPNTPSLYSVEYDQNKQKSTQSSSSSAIDHPTKRCLDPPRMLTLAFFLAPIRDRRLSSTRSKIFLKETSGYRWTKFQRSHQVTKSTIAKIPFRNNEKLEEGNGHRPRTVPGSSRGREEILANYCG